MVGLVTSLCTAAPHTSRQLSRSLRLSCVARHLAYPSCVLSRGLLMSAASAAAAAGAGAAATGSDMGQQEQQQPGAEQDVKKSIRQHLKKKLKSLSSESMQQQSSQIAQHVLQSRFFHDASNVGLYITCERLREADTAALLQEALSHGKQVFVPLVEDSSSNMSMLHIDTLQDLQPAPPFGILEPSRNHPDGSPRMEVLQAPYQLDLLLMPGLGFDNTGGRLGRGGGYYDKLVHNLDDRAQQRHWHRPWLVALAFDEQLSDEALPMDPHDRHVDVLATPGGLLLCSERARAHMQQQSRGQAPAAT